MAIIKHRFWISAPLSKVYEAIGTLAGIRGWWTTQTSGAYFVDGQFRATFAEGKYSMFAVTTLKKNESVVWRCDDTTLPDKDWIGTTIGFSLAEDEEGDVVVDFEHDGWASANDFYAICNFQWGFYLNSLKMYCETGEGVAEE